MLAVIVAIAAAGIMAAAVMWFLYKVGKEIVEPGIGRKNDNKNTKRRKHHKF